MMPLSYQGFGFTTILLMVTMLTLVQILRYIKDRRHKNDHQKNNLLSKK